MILEVSETVIYREYSAPSFLEVFFANVEAVGGDSGAWVIDNEHGRVCGHVLAERDGMTYICSMQLLFEDIKYTLGATRVSLPGSSIIDSQDEDAKDSVTSELGQRPTAQTGALVNKVAALELLDGSVPAMRSRFGKTGANGAGAKKLGEYGRLGGGKQRQAQAVRT